MSEQNEKETPKSRVKKGSSSFIFVVLAIVILSVFGFYFYTQKSSFNPFTGDSSAPGGTQEKQEAATATSPLDKTGEDTTLTDTTTLSDPETLTDGLLSPEEQEELTDGSTLTDSEEQLPEGEEYQHLIDDLNGFYTHLDKQPYMQAFQLDKPSKTHFSELLQKLVDNPPVVSRETDDLFTLLKNTAHFFRVLGKDNIVVLKGILDREKDSFEETLKTFYTLTSQPEYLKKEYSLTIPFDALYDYAGFFLNTMGGRLYLFRRDSTSRLMVSYYAILIIDQANDEGSSYHGIDLQPVIDSLIEEIENGGKLLRLKEEYLDKLYDLKEKYS